MAEIDYWDRFFYDDPLGAGTPDPERVKAAICQKKAAVPKPAKHTIASLSTKYLLRGLHYARIHGAARTRIGNLTFEVIKAELAKRPHIDRKAKVREDRVLSRPERRSQRLGVPTPEHEDI